VSSFVRMLSRCESLVKPNKASRGHADDLEHQVAIWLQRIVFPRLSMYTCKNKEVIHRDSEVVCQVIVCKLRRETSAPPRKPRSTTHQKHKKKKKAFVHQKNLSLYRYSVQDAKENSDTGN
jgi:transposase